MGMTLTVDAGQADGLALLQAVDQAPDLPVG